jgi:hypothetical protein
MMSEKLKPWQEMQTGEGWSADGSLVAPFPRPDDERVQPQPSGGADIDAFREALRRLIGGCPLGYHEGMLITGRRSSDADIVAWLQDLWAFVDAPAEPRP